MGFPAGFSMISTNNGFYDYTAFDLYIPFLLIPPMLLAVLFLALTLLIGIYISRHFFDSNLLLYAIPSGLVVSTWTVFIVSLLLSFLQPFAGFSMLSIGISCIVLFLLILFDQVRHPFDFNPSSYLDVSLYPLFTVALLAFSLLNANLLTLDAKGQLVGNGLDLGFYLSITSSISEGNFPPHYPILSSEPLSYYYFLFFYSSILVKGGLGLLLAFNLYFTLLFVSFISLLFLLAKKLLSSQAFAYLAVLLFLFSGGFAFLAHLQDFDFSDSKALEQLFTNPKFFLQYRSYGYPVTNLFTLGLVTKPDLVGMLFFLVAAAYFLYSKQPRSRHRLLAGILFGLTGMFNLPLALVTFSFLATYALLFDRKKEWLYFFSPAAFLLLAQFLLFFSKKVSTATSALSLKPLWFLQGTPFSDPLTFWLLNFGMFFVLGITGFFFAPKPLRQFVAALLPAFLFLNFFQIFPWGVDNFKLVQPLFLILILLSALAFKKFWSWKRLGRYGQLVVPLLLLPTILTGYFSVVSLLHWTAIDQYKDPLCPLPYMEMASFVKETTPSSSIFIADEQAEITCLVALAGRKTFMSNNYWLEGHGFDFSSYAQLNQRMLEGDCSLARKYGVTHAYEDANFGWRIPQALKDKSKLLFQKGGLALYEITGC